MENKLPQKPGRDGHWPSLRFSFIIFFDPPYIFDGVSEILKIVKERNILKDGGLFIYERVVDKQCKQVTGFELIQSRKYGIAVFDFYRISEE